ncbi:Vam6/Vps39-like protein [Kappamyces sp. JEL0680]|nr:Vam6/Vps39-like protein [Kappamyces sp. JEL0680]
MPFNVVLPQVLVQSLPLSISCFDAKNQKIFIGIKHDNTVLDYDLDEDSGFSITLARVHKQVVAPSLSLLQISILLASRSLALLTSDGQICLTDYSAAVVKAAPLHRIKQATTLGRSSFPGPNASDVLAVGVKRGLVMFTVSALEVGPCQLSQIREMETIKLPHTPNEILFASPIKMLASCKNGGVYLIDTAQSSSQTQVLQLFSLPQESIFSKQPPYLVNILKRTGVASAIRQDSFSDRLDPSAKHHTMIDSARDSQQRRSLSLNHKPSVIGSVNRNSVTSHQSSRSQSVLADQDAAVEVVAYCTRDTQFFRISTWSQSSLFIFHWSSSPVAVVVDDYYAIGLLASGIEVRSLKTGSLLQEIPLENVTMMKLGEVTMVANENNLWRLLPLDFDDQIDDLLAQHRFIDAEAFLNELEFETEEEKRANLVKVKGGYAQYLFMAEHKYKEAIQVLEDLNASPLDVVELYPDLMEEHCDTKSDPSALHHLSRYLSRERVKLLKYQKELEDQIASCNQSMSSIRSMTVYEALESSLTDVNTLVEFVETCLLQVYLVTKSPLLGPLLRVSTSCNYTRVVALLVKYGKSRELVEFYKARGHHHKALTYITTIEKPGDHEMLIAYLQQLDMNKHLDIVFEFARTPLQTDGSVGLRIFTENHQSVDAGYRLKIFHYLREMSPTLGLAYLEYLVHSTQDRHKDINTCLFVEYLEAAGDLSGANVQRFSSFVYSNIYYDAEAVLAAFPPNGTETGLTLAYWEEKAHVLSRLHRHREALEIFVRQLANMQLAEQYCLENYRRHDPKANYLFTALFELAEGEFATAADRLAFITKYAFRLHAIQAIEAFDDSLSLGNTRALFANQTLSLLSYSCRNSIQNHLLQLQTTFVRTGRQLIR